MSAINGTTPHRAQVPPRGHQNPGGDPTAPPRRAAFPPSHEPPKAPDPSKSAVEEHWRKHPSDYHADIATDHLIKATLGTGTAERAEQRELAHIYALLSQRDATLELAAVMRDIRDGKKKVNPS